MNTPEVKVKKIIDKLLKQYEFVKVERPAVHPWASHPGYKQDVEWPFAVPNIIDDVRLLWWFKPSSGAYGKSGIPDYVGCMCGTMFGIEAKANGGKLTDLQANAMRQISAAGGRTFVVHGQMEGPLRREVLMNVGFHELKVFLEGERAAFIARHTLGIPNHDAKTKEGL